MPAQTPPVPSKNALRALRNLAFGAPGLVVGAVGSACGLVAVNCEARRRVRLAEKILERKHSISSLANGRSSSRVRRMYEAAERGEDFLLDPRNSNKRRQRRSSSLTTLRRRQKETDFDVEAMLQAIGGTVVQNKNVQVKRSSEDSRTGPDQPKPSRGIPLPIKSPLKDLKDSSLARGRSPSSSSTPGRRADHLNTGSNTFSALAFSSSGSFPSRDRGFLLSGGGSALAGTSPEHIQHDQLHAHQADLRRHYAEDLCQSPAERIRLATMKPMKRDSYSVYARQPHPPGSEAASVSSNVDYNSKEPSQPFSLDLAPTAASSSLNEQSMPLVSQHTEADSAHESMTTTASSTNVAGDVDLPIQEMPHKSTFNFGNAPFAEWLGLTEDYASDAGLVLATGKQALGLNYLQFFDNVHAFVQSESSGTKHKESQVIGREGYTASSLSNPDMLSAIIEQANREKWLRPPHRTSSIGWLALVQQLKNIDTSTDMLERDTILFARQYGEAVVSSKITETARQRKQRTKVEDEELLAAHWAVPNHELKASVFNQSNPPGRMRFDSKIDAFLAPTPTLRERGQARLHQLLKVVGFDLYADACTDTIRNQDPAKKMIGLSSKLAELVEKGSEQDLNLAELLFHTLYWPQKRDSRISTLSESAARVVHKLLKQQVASAVAILFPYDFEDAIRIANKMKDKRAVILYGNANTYLKARCYAIQDPILLCEEVRQLLHIAASAKCLSDDCPLDHLILPAIRSLCAMGEDGQALQLLEEIERNYTSHYDNTLESRAVIIRSFAKKNNAVKMKLMLDDLHTHGISRERSMWFSHLFSQVFELHLLNNTVQDSYDILIHALAFCGLMPDSRVSSALITACLKDERYDFIQEYVQAVRQLYPFLDLGTKNALFAWRVARAWKEMEASCDQVQKGCLAMAYCATTEPFGRSLLDAAEEAVRLDLSRCLSTLLSMDDSQSVLEIFRSLRCLEFDKLIEKAQQVSAKTGLATEAYLRAKDHLFKQIKAVTRLNRLFGGDHMGDHIEVSSRHRPAWRKRTQLQDSEDNGGFAVQIFQEREGLPRREILWALMANHYAHNQRRLLPANHDLLKHVVVEMMRLERTPEAAKLINAIHKSPYTSGSSGTSFSEEIFEMWFEVGVRLRSPRVMIQTLWAFMETTTDVIISHSFLLRVDTALDKAITGFFAVENGNSFRPTHEMQYLRDRLKTRYARQMGIDGYEDKLLWNEYKSWDEMTTPMPVTEDQKVTDEEGEKPYDWASYYSSIGGTPHAVRAY